MDDRIMYHYLLITDIAIYSGYMLNEQAWEIAKSHKTCVCQRFDDKAKMLAYMEKMSIKND